jgi:transposase
MSLQVEEENQIPILTATIARTAFPKGNKYMTMRDKLGMLFKDEQFEGLFSTRGQPATAPWRLSLVTIMQFMEDLTDRKAADAVRGRLDWKYALGLDLDDEGFDYSVLSEFRTRLLKGGAETMLFDTLLEWCQKEGCLTKGRRQRTDSTNVIAAVASLHRIELVGQTLYRVLDLLAQVAPDWLRQQTKPEWYKRYRQPITDYHIPKEENERQALLAAIGEDGVYLLHRIYAEGAPEYLRTIPAVEVLRRVWLQNYYQEGEIITWRKEGNIPPASVRIASPFDLEARFSAKRDSIFWLGYKVHVTETCDEDAPHLITHVETTMSTLQDNLALEGIQTALKDKKLLPAQHFLDSGYISAENLVSSQKAFGLELIGPVRADNSWQTRQEGTFSATQFQIDWEKKQVICPMGKISSCWSPSKSRFDQPTIQVRFRDKDCLDCVSRAKCTRSKISPRNLCIRPQEFHLAIQAARQRQATNEFWKAYSVRSGIEGTIGLAADKLGMRRSRYYGLAKTHLQNLFTATAINMQRILNWWAEIPRSRTRVSHLAALAPT